MVGRPATDWIGKKVGMLLVCERIGSKGTSPLYLAVCDCGNRTAVTSSHLRGASISCGCYRKRNKPRLRHGYAPKHSPKAKIYKVWLSMRSRCNNPKAAGYERYGAKGITVCERWNSSFDAFLEDMGEMPSPKHQIERNDNSKGYEPGNCRWVTPGENAVNRKSTVLDEDKVRYIRAHPEIPLERMARLLDCSMGAVRGVRSGKSWQHVK